MNTIRAHYLQGIWKKALPLLVALSLVLSGISSGLLVSFAASEGITWQVGENVTAELSDEGLLRLSGTGDTYDYSTDEDNRAPFYDLRDAVMSLEIEGGITAIGDYLFYNCKNLTGTLILPETLVYIGDGAFSGDDEGSAPAFKYVFNNFVETDITHVIELPAQPVVVVSEGAVISPEAIAAEETQATPAAVLPEKADIVPENAAEQEAAAPGVGPDAESSIVPETLPEPVAETPPAPESEPASETESEPDTVPVPADGAASQPAPQPAVSETSPSAPISEPEHAPETLPAPEAAPASASDLASDSESAVQPDCTVDAVEQAATGTDGEVIQVTVVPVPVESIHCVEAELSNLEFREGIVPYAGQPSEAVETEETDCAITTAHESVPDVEYRYEIEHITQQEIGEDIFFSGQSGVYETEEASNEAFRSAAEDAGYMEILDWVNINFADGFGTERAVRVPETALGVFLPDYTETGLSWPEESLLEYTFLGWMPRQTESEPTQVPADIQSSKEEAAQAVEMPAEAARIPSDGQVIPEQIEIAESTDLAEPADSTARQNEGAEPADIAASEAVQQVRSADYGELCCAYEFCGGVKSYAAEWRTAERRLENQTIRTTVAMPDGAQLAVAITGTLPVNAGVSAEVVAVETAQSILEEQLGTDSGNTVLYALDIAILVDGVKYQPSQYGESVSVSVTNIEVNTSGEVAVYHLAEDEATGATALETAPIESVEQDAVAFTADSFSYYFIVINNSCQVSFESGPYEIEYNVVSSGSSYEPLVTPYVTCPEASTLYFKATLEMNHRIISVSADTGADITELTSEAGVFTITPAANTAVLIKSIGIDQQACKGCTISAVTTGMSDELSYQWQSSADSTSWADVSGATVASYQIPSDASGYYRVLVTEEGIAEEYPSLPVGPVGDEKAFDISYGNVTITNTTFAGFDANGNSLTGDHSINNIYKVSGTTGNSTDGGGFHIALSGPSSFTVLLDNVSIYTGTRTEGVYSPFETSGVTGAGNITVLLSGTNILQNCSFNASSSFAGLEKVNSASTMIIDSFNHMHDHSQGDCTAASCGKLSAYGGADSSGIGGSDSRRTGSGVQTGYGDTSHITILGGEIYTTAIASQSAGIGSGNNKEATDISIYGGNITAIGFQNGAGIGGSGGITGTGCLGEVSIYGGTVTAYSNGNGAGIGGGGSDSERGGNGKVAIFGGTVYTTSNGGVGAGIGGGGNIRGSLPGGSAEVWISGGTVEVTGNIGGGSADTGSGGSATISMSGGTVHSNSIGGGYSNVNGYNNSGMVTITGGSLNSAIADMPTNGANYVYLTTVTLYHTDSIKPDMSVSAVTAGSISYGTYGMKTDVAGKLYLWLPYDVVVTAVLAETDLYEGNVAAMSQGQLLYNSALVFYNVTMTEVSEYYSLYLDEEKNEPYAGAVGCESGNEFEFWVQAATYGGVAYYSIEAYVPSGNGANVTELDPMGTTASGLYHYTFTVTTDTEVWFTFSDASGKKTLLNIYSGAVVISDDPNDQGTALCVSHGGRMLSGYTGSFLMTSRGHSTTNTLTLNSGTANVLVDKCVLVGSGSLVTVNGGELNLSAAGSFDNQMASLDASVINVGRNGKLNLSIEAGDALELTGGSGSPVIGGSGDVNIIEEGTASHLTMNQGQGSISQIRAGSYTYRTLSMSGIALPYSLELASSETLIGYQKVAENKLYITSAAQTVSEDTTFRACGLTKNLTGVNVNSESVDNSSGDYKMTFSQAPDTYSVHRDGVALTEDDDYILAGNVLTIRGSATYGNLTVLASDQNNTYAYIAAGYSGAYDAQPHGVSVHVTNGGSPAVYYGTQELTASNYNASGTGDTVSPTRTDAGTTTVYWYVPASGNYTAASGSLAITVTQAVNSWTENLACPSLLQGENVTPHAAARFGEVTYTYCHTAGGTYEAGTPSDAGQWYVKANVAATANFTQLVSAPVSFTIERAVVCAEVGRKLDRMNQTVNRTVTIPADSAFSAFVSFDYTTNSAKPLNIRCSRMLPAGTALTLIDYGSSNTITEYYRYVLTTEDSRIDLSEFRRMGVAAGSGNGTFPVLQNGTRATANFQICVALPSSSSLTGSITLDSYLGDTKLSGTELTVNFEDAIGNPSGSVSSVTATGDVESLRAEITVSNIIVGNTGKTPVLAVSLLDSTGGAVSFSGNNVVTFDREAQGGSIAPTVIHGNLAVLSGITPNTYAVNITNLDAGNYKLKADVCFADSADSADHSVRYPLAASEATATSNDVAVAAAAQYAIKAELTQPSGSEGEPAEQSRILTSGAATTLRFTLTYTPNTAVSGDFSAILYRKTDEDTYASSIEWAATPVFTCANGNNGEGLPVGTGTATISAPALEPGTYRIVFTIRDDSSAAAAEYNYNFIVK